MCHTRDLQTKQEQLHAAKQGTPKWRHKHLCQNICAFPQDSKVLPNGASRTQFPKAALHNIRELTCAVYALSDLLLARTTHHVKMSTRTDAHAYYSTLAGDITSE